jgi:hypothetical protein
LTRYNQIIELQLFSIHLPRPAVDSRAVALRLASTCYCVHVALEVVSFLEDAVRRRHPTTFENPFGDDILSTDQTNVFPDDQRIVVDIAVDTPLPFLDAMDEMMIFSAF